MRTIKGKFPEYFRFCTYIHNTYKHTYICVYVGIHICVYTCVHIYIYIYQKMKQNNKTLCE